MALARDIGPEELLEELQLGGAGGLVGARDSVDRAVVLVEANRAVCVETGPTQVAVLVLISGNFTDPFPQRRC